MDTIASLITSLTIVYSTVHSDADQRKHQSPASLAFEWGIHRGPVNSPHKWPVTRKMVPFDDVIMFKYWVHTDLWGSHRHWWSRLPGRTPWPGTMHALRTYTLKRTYIDGLVHGRHNSSALAMGLHLSCTNPSIYGSCYQITSFHLTMFTIAREGVGINILSKQYKCWWNYIDHHWNDNQLANEKDMLLISPWRCGYNSFF